jgi:diacylglycerol kinase
MLKFFFKSVGYAIKGIGSSLQEQRNLKVQIFIAVIVVGASAYLEISAIEWSIVLITIGMVIGTEMINTAIESLVDLVTLERKPQAGKIKDIAAGAVLFVSIIAVIVGVLIFRKYLIG